MKNVEKGDNNSPSFTLLRLVLKAAFVYQAAQELCLHLLQTIRDDRQYL